MILIGFAGRKRTGKDTAGQTLVATLGFRRVAFATPLKTMLRALLEVQRCPHDTIEAMVEGELKETPSPYLAGQSPRHAMQTLGAEWGRQLMSPTIWVDATIRAAKLHKRAVVTDVRYPNEVAAIKAAGGFVYRIVRPDFPPADDTHSSESQIDDLVVDGEILNSGPRLHFQELVFDRVTRAFNLQPS